MNSKHHKIPKLCSYSTGYLRSNLLIEQSAALINKSSQENTHAVGMCFKNCKAILVGVFVSRHAKEFSIATKHVGDDHQWVKEHM